MSETLRPCTLGEILDRTAQLYRRNFWVLAGVSALPIGVILAVTVAAFAIGIGAAVTLRGAPPNAAAAVAFVVFLLIAIPIYIAVYVYSIGAMTQIAIGVNRGEKLTIRAALKSVKPHFWRYLWFLILQALWVVLVPVAIAGIVIAGLIYLTSSAGAGPGGSIAAGFLAFILGAAAFGVIVWRLLGYSIGFPVCVMEQKTAWDSLQRAWELSERSRGRIFVLFLLLGAIAMAVSMIGYIPFVLIVSVVTAAGSNPQTAATALAIAEIVNMAVNFTLQALIAPVSWIALVLFYYDQRIRKEGFDIEWMMEQAGLAQLTPAAPAPEIPGISGPVTPPDTVGER